MSKLIIQRAKEFFNSWRKYEIYLDGQEIDVISNGQTKEIELSPGQHTLFVKIDWCRSSEISVEVGDNETKIVKVEMFENSNWIAPLIIGIPCFCSLFNKVPGINYLFFAAIPLFFILLYYITLGRKKYLTLKEM